MRIPLLLLLLTLIIISCNDKKDDNPNVLSREQIVDILADIQLVEAKLSFEKRSLTDLDELSERYYESLFLKYNISKEQFDESLHFYENNTEALNDIYTDVITKLNKIQGDINKGLYLPAENDSSVVADTLKLGKIKNKAVKKRIDIR